MNITINGKLTDESGNQFEYIKAADNFADGLVLLKPLKVEEKKEYTLQFFRTYGDVVELLEQNYDLTEEQATAISKSLEALMDFVTNTDTERPKWDSGRIYQVEELAKKARELYQNEH